ncbi:MAG: hypothetical protein NT080_05800 [Spirochaetes bacterium]|nr:hypothetical protein [Spirochaetota bacterium]
MKKIIVIVLAVVVAASAFAQAPGNQAPGAQGQAGPWGNQAPVLKSVTLEGRLDFSNEEPVLIAKDGKSYFIRMPRFYYYAYMDGIKKDAALRIEGYELPTWPGQTIGNIQVVKATFAGKVYDFSAFDGAGGGPGGRRGMMGGFGGGPGGGRGMTGGCGMPGGRW